MTRRHGPSWREVGSARAQRAGCTGGRGVREVERGINRIVSEINEVREGRQVYRIPGRWKRGRRTAFRGRPRPADGARDDDIARSAPRLDDADPVKGVAAREGSIAFPQGVQANGTYGRTDEVRRACRRKRLPYRGQECIRRVLCRITHKGQERRNVPGRERVIWQGGRVPGKVRK